MELRELKAKIILNGLTQVQLSKKIGINTKIYNMKENGKNKFSLEEAAKVSEVLKLSLNEVNNIFLQVKLPKGNKFRR